MSGAGSQGHDTASPHVHMCRQDTSTVSLVAVPDLAELALKRYTTAKQQPVFPAQQHQAESDSPTPPVNPRAAAPRTSEDSSSSLSAAFLFFGGGFAFAAGRAWGLPASPAAARFRGVAALFALDLEGVLFGELPLYHDSCRRRVQFTCQQCDHHKCINL